MRLDYDPDLWKGVSEYRECTRCHGRSSLCDGGCNGVASYTQVRRSDEEVAAIKAKRQREHDVAILAEADSIRRHRQPA